MDAVHEAAALVAEQPGEKIEGVTSQLEHVVFQRSSLREELVKIAEALRRIDKPMLHMYEPPTGAPRDAPQPQERHRW